MLLPRASRRLVGGIVGALAALALAATGVACTSNPPDPAPTAQALAAALSAGDVSDIWFDDQPAVSVQDDLDEALAGMAPATLTATAAGTRVDESGEEPRGIVTLELTWDLDGDAPGSSTWTYESEALLVPQNQPDESDWQVRWNRFVLHPELIDTAVLSLTRTQAARADIVGAGGTTLVTNRPVQRIGIDKLRLEGGDPEPSARAVAEVVGIDPDAYVERVAAAGDEAFVEAIVMRENEAAPLLSVIEGIDGGRAVPGELPLAPSRDFARPLLGTVGPATAEIVESSQGEVAGTDLVGLSGLQARYDSQLRGQPGYVVESVDAAGSEEQSTRTELFSLAPESGEPLVLSLDLDAQRLADDLLADLESPTALVAMRASTGELVAVASGPAGNGYSTATLGQYAPGSIFKTVSAMALLRDGETPTSRLPCTESVTIDGKPFTNYSDYPSTALGDITLATAFAQSCNTAFVSQVDALDWPAVADAAESLGIAPGADLGFEAFLGSLGEPDSRVEQAAGLIGQGTVLLSPLGAATMAASASVGTVVPVLVDVGPMEPGEPTAAPENAAVMDMMRLAVTDGTATLLADVPGPPVAAKTGTAEFGSATPPDTHAWMIGVQDDLAVAVFVERGESGSSTAGPIMRELLSEVRPLLNLSATASR